MIPYARQSIDDSDIAAVVEVLRSDFLTQGPVVPRFERCVAEYCGAAYAVAVSNATSALHLGALALGLKAGGLLWTSPISFVASANCGLYCGADVDFVDIDPRTYTISIAALSEKLKAAERDARLPDVIVAVDYGGQPAYMSALAALRARYGFRIIEDASHAIGASYRGEPVGRGSYADVTVFSFHPVKIITTGEGGMGVTNDEEVAERMRLLSSHGVTRDVARMSAPGAPWEYEQQELGFNYRLTEIQAALGLAQMQRIDQFVRRRRELATLYTAAFAQSGIVTPYEEPEAQSAWHLYPVQVQNRRGTYDALKTAGIAANVHYKPIYLQPHYRRLGFLPGYCPNAESFYARALSLPMYANLTDGDQRHVIDTLLQLEASCGA